MPLQFYLMHYIASALLKTTHKLCNAFFALFF